MAEPDFDKIASDVRAIEDRIAEKLRKLHAEWKAAGAEAERERCAKIAREHAEHAYRERMKHGPYMSLFGHEDAGLQIQREIEDVPRSDITEQPQPAPADTCRETFGTKACVRTRGHEGHHESRSGSCWPLSTAPLSKADMARAKEIAAEVNTALARAVELFRTRIVVCEPGCKCDVCTFLAEHGGGK